MNTLEDNPDYRKNTSQAKIDEQDLYSLPVKTDQIELEKKQISAHESMRKKDSLNIKKREASGLANLKKALCKKYGVYVVNSSESEILFETVIELPNEKLVEDLFQVAISCLNTQLKSVGKDQELSTDIEQYKIYTAKKSGMPKTDYPPCDRTQNCAATQISNFCLLMKSEKAIIRKSEPKVEVSIADDNPKPNIVYKYVCLCIPVRTNGSEKTKKLIEK